MKKKKLQKTDSRKAKFKGGRPPSAPITFRDGFYFEVRNRDTERGQGVKLRKDTYKEMLEAAKEYQKIKLVTLLGEYKNGKPVKPVKVKKRKG